MVDYLLFISGIFITIISLILFKKEATHQLLSDKKSNEYDEKKLLDCIDLAEDIITELKDISADIIEQIDMKTIEAKNLLDILDKKNHNIVNNINAENNENIDYRDMNVLEMENELATPSADEPYNNEVFTLYNEGYSAAQIAKKLDKGIGEIQLILKLKKR